MGRLRGSQAKPTCLRGFVYGKVILLVILLAGLQSIPKSLYEAAEIDGAGMWHRFKHITWPLLTPVTFFVLVMSIISSFQVFAQVYTGQN